MAVLSPPPRVLGEAAASPPAVNFAVGVPLLFFGYLLGDHLSRQSTRATFATYLLVLLSAPLWLIQPLETTFEYVKIASVFVPIQVLNLLRLAFALEARNNDPPAGRRGCSGGCAGMLLGLRQRAAVVYWFLFAVLAINISEAVAADVELGNYANAACGVLLVATQPGPALTYAQADSSPRWRRFMGIDTAGGGPSKHDFLYDLPLSWSLLYTAWNLCFALDERRSHFASIAAVLAAPIARALWNRRYDLWVQSRVYTLAIRYALLAYYDVYDEFIDSSAWHSADAVATWGYVNLALAVLYAAWHVAFVAGCIGTQPFALGSAGPIGGGEKADEVLPTVAPAQIVVASKVEAGAAGGQPTM